MKFTESSSDNIKFLKNHYSLDNRPLNISYFLKRIHHKLKKINIKHYHYIKHTNINVVEHPSFYFPNDIVNHINGSSYIEYIIKMKKQNYNFIIKLYSETPIHIKHYIQKIKTILLLFIHCKPIHQLKYNTIHIYLTEFKKNIKAMNSGLAYSNRIILYRKEEWFKVFIHECIHLFDFDFHNHTDFSKMKSYFPIESQMLLFESYTEFWARIINIAILSKSKTFKMFEYKFNKYFRMERLYSTILMNKLLNHQHLTYRQLLQPNHYKESTNLFCYSVIPSLLFFYMNESISFFVSNNEKLFDYVGNVDDFMNFVIYLHKKEEWLSYVEYIKYYNTNNMNMALYDKVF